MCLVDLHVAAVRVGLDRAVVEDTDGHLGIRGLRAELVVGVTQALADRVYTDEGEYGHILAGGKNIPVIRTGTGDYEIQ